MVDRGAPLAEVHARSDTAAEQAAREVLAAYEIADDRAEHVPVVLETIA
jgi:thymidine phosphorylase